MFLSLSVAAAVAAQAPADGLEEPIWQMPNGEIMFREYPVQAGGAKGKVAFRMTTSADGAPQACEVTKSSGNLVLDREACRSLMMYAKFKPVKIRNGVQVVKGMVNWSPAEAAAVLAAMRNPQPVVHASVPKGPPTPRWRGWSGGEKQDRNAANEKLVCKRVPRADTIAAHEYRCRSAESWARHSEADGFWGELQGRRGTGVGVR